MISYEEVARAIYGIWRLARLDPRALSCFNATVVGFWRSFFAAVICAPADALIIAITSTQQPPVEASGGRVFLVHAIAYVIGWTAFPLAMAPMTRLLQRDAFYVRYIVIHNWTNILEVTLFLPAAALAATGVPAFVILPLIALILIFAYQWYVARVALALSGFQATAVVGLDLLIDFALIMVVGILLPGAAPGA